MYSREDFMLLETMEDFEITEAIKIAKENYDSIQQLYAEDNEDSPFDFDKIPMEILINKLKEVENYIRRAENLLNEIEIDRTYIRKCINRRKNFLKRKRLNKKL